MVPGSSPVAIVTGAAAGIGRALAGRLAQRKWNLWLVDRDEAGLAIAQHELSAQSVSVETTICDLAEPAQLEALASTLLKKLPAIELLVNNAGVVHYGPTDAMASADLERLMAVNLLAPLQLTHLLLPRLLAEPPAHLMNIASIYGIYARRHTAAYHASKFGLVGFSRSLQREYAGRMTVTTVCPGFVETNLFSSGTSSMPDGVVQRPPAFLCTTADNVASVALRKMDRGGGLVLAGWHAYLLYYTEHIFPGLLNSLGTR